MLGWSNHFQGIFQYSGELNVPCSKTQYGINSGHGTQTLSIWSPMLNHYATVIQDPVVQSIVSLTISLRHKFVKQISTKVTNTLLFFVEKM